jgi:hypothetical protein
MLALYRSVFRSHTEVVGVLVTEDEMVDGNIVRVRRNLAVLVRISKGSEKSHSILHVGIDMPLGQGPQRQWQRRLHPSTD